MGYTNSPAVMAQIMAGIVKRCRSEGIRLIHYADDWLIMAATKAECARHRALAVRIIEEHGFVVHTAAGIVGASMQHSTGNCTSSRTDRASPHTPA